MQARVEVREVSDSQNLRAWLSDPQATGEQVSWQVDPPLADGDYRWRMHSEDTDSTAASA